LLKIYCGAGLRRCRPLKNSTYRGVRLAFSLACALHTSLLTTIFNNLMDAIFVPAAHVSRLKKHQYLL
jgi:hypothetical protein